MAFPGRDEVSSEFLPGFGVRGYSTDANLTLMFP